MKKHLSVFSLYIRASLVPMIILLAVMSAVQGAMFAAELRYEIIQSSSGIERYIRGLDSLFGDTYIPHAALVSVILLTVLLAIQGASFSSKTAYTMGRLSVSEKSAFLWQAGYNSLSFLLFWAAQGVLMFALCEWYASSVSNATEQTVLLALYRDEFLHGMLPLHDASRIVRNAAFCIALGTMTAYYTFTQRNGKASIVLAPTILYAIGAFRMGEISLSGDIIHIVICLFFTAVVIVKVLTGYRFLFSEDEKDTLWNS